MWSTASVCEVSVCACGCVCTSLCVCPQRDRRVQNRFEHNFSKRSVKQGLSRRPSLFSLVDGKAQSAQLECQLLGRRKYVEIGWKTKDIQEVLAYRRMCRGSAQRCYLPGGDKINSVWRIKSSAKVRATDAFVCHSCWHEQSLRQELAKTTDYKVKLAVDESLTEALKVSESFKPFISIHQC